MLRSKFVLYSALLILIFLVGCYTILTVDQPASVSPGQKFTAHLYVRTQPDTNGTLNTTPYRQIVSMEIPNDWTVDSVYFIGTTVSPDTGYFTFLPENQPDSDPSFEDYWTRSLESRYPSTDSTQWVTYQSFQPVLPQQDTTYNDVYIEMTAGTMEGDFNLSYFVTNGHLDFSKDYYYSISRGNRISVSNASAIRDENSGPGQFYLEQNYPNPFNSRTVIRYSVEHAGFVSLALYSVDGRKIKDMVNGIKTSGVHTFNFDAEGLASGIYIYKLQAESRVKIMKMVLIN